MFIKHSSGSFIALLVYVDDVIVASNDIHQITQVKTYLHDQFKIKDLGDLKFFLGLEVARSKAGINLCQRNYCLDLLKDVGFLGAKPASTPMVANLRLSKESGDPLLDITGYR